MERLGKLKKSNDLIGNRPRELPACSIVPQPTTLPHSEYLRNDLITGLVWKDFSIHPNDIIIALLHNCYAEVLLGDWFYSK
jgi:hypothetical protein